MNRQINQFIKRIREKFAFEEFSWKAILIITTFSTGLYLLSEWIFIITRPSYLVDVPFLTKLSILFFTFSAFCLALYIILFVLIALQMVTKRVSPKFIQRLSILIPAIICSSLLLLLIDNFTYTVFHFGIVSTRSFRYLYLALFIFFLFFFYTILSRKTEDLKRVIQKNKYQKWILPGLIFPSMLLCVISYVPNKFSNICPSQNTINQGTDQPNIILITADGVDALHTSLYGYYRITTPRLQEIARDSLLAENAFTNSSSTAGSVIAIYTGRYPTTTRVLYPPDILKNQYSYQHMLCILKGQGYRMAQFSYPYYTDAYDRNLQSGFDIANGRSQSTNSAAVIISDHLETNRAFFIYEISNRILNRLGHILSIIDMDNLGSLALGKGEIYDDSGKIDKALDFLGQSSQPAFIHVHWMGTHGPYYYPNVQVYSKGKSTKDQNDWDVDLYDDSIAEFDRGVGRIIDSLKSTGEYDNTILIIGSDHGQVFNSNKKIPLLIHFPNNQPSGVLENNVQNIDIAPTIIDYLHLQIPAWMEGDSLLSNTINERPIYSFGIDLKRPTGNLWVEYHIKPPYYQFEFINLVYCEKYFRLNLRTFQWDSDVINGHTAPCSSSNGISEETALQWMIIHLKEKGFNTSNFDELKIDL